VQAEETYALECHQANNQAREEERIVEIRVSREVSFENIRRIQKGRDQAYNE